MWPEIFFFYCFLLKKKLTPAKQNVLFKHSTYMFFAPFASISILLKTEMLLSKHGKTFKKIYIYEKNHKKQKENRKDGRKC